MESLYKQVNKRVKQTFPDQLVDCMELSGYNIAQVAEGIGVEPSRVSQWKAGTYMPSLSSGIALADFLGVTVELLFLGKERWS